MRVVIEHAIEVEEDDLHRDFTRRNVMFILGPALARLGTECSQNLCIVPAITRRLPGASIMRFCSPPYRGLMRNARRWPSDTLAIHGSRPSSGSSSECHPT